MADRSKLYDNPRSPKSGREAKKGDTLKFDVPGNEDEWESIGERWQDDKGNTKGTVDPAEIDGDDVNWDNIRVKDRDEEGNRKEFFKRKTAKSSA